MTSTKYSCKLLAATAVAVLAAILANPTRAQEAEEAKTPAVTVEAIAVEPAAPGPDTLCQLTVKLKNGGSKIASLFAFKVEVNGHKLPVYDRELFALPVEAGSSADLRLFNFWTTETGRPAPADGKLAVAVSLEEAQWVTVTTEDKVEVWTPAGAVEGLPATASVSLKMKR